LLAGVALLGAGCGKEEGKGGQGPAAQTKKVHDHSAWWCDEHGIPEHLCKMCKTELKTKDDVTCEHDLVKSQCFRCNPEKREYYAQMYRARYAGKDPPPAVDQGDKPTGAKD
jgi:hypothetical protein